jgi:hypothetical protein
MPDPDILAELKAGVEPIGRWRRQLIASIRRAAVPFLVRERTGADSPLAALVAGLRTTTTPAVAPSTYPAGIDGTVRVTVPLGQLRDRPTVRSRVR